MTSWKITGFDDQNTFHKTTCHVSQPNALVNPHIVESVNRIMVTEQIKAQFFI